MTPPLAIAEDVRTPRLITGGMTASHKASLTTAHRSPSLNRTGIGILLVEQNANMALAIAREG